MRKIVKKHPLAIRWFHWINFPILAIMIWSGLLIYWANDVYNVRLGGKSLFKFFPDSFYKALSLNQHLAEGMAFHFVFMWVFFLNGFLYVLYTWISGQWRYLVPNRSSFREAWQVLLHDLHIRKMAPPQIKYNGAQKIAYSAIIVMGLGSILTGLAIYKPIQLQGLCLLFGGYGTTRVIHFVLTIGYCLFFVVHIVQVILAGWNNFRGMVTGYELIREKSPGAGIGIATTVRDASPVGKPIATGRKEPPFTEVPIAAKIARRKAIISFSGFLLLGAGAWKGWTWLKDQPKAHGPQGGVQLSLRNGLNADEKVFEKTLSDTHLARTYPVSAAAKQVRANGDIGLDTAGFDAAAWKLAVTKTSGEALSLGIDEIRQLPKTEIVFEFKCIEGWSQVSYWGGARFSDFIQRYGLDAEAAMKYISLSTPDQAYYVGIDMPSALHPQTLLCYEMNGQPLPAAHGAPLRLIIPVKYGIKNLKRISHLSFSNERPRDYWFERGYDYYSGL